MVSYKTQNEEWNAPLKIFILYFTTSDKHYILACYLNIEPTSAIIIINTQIHKPISLLNAHCTKSYYILLYVCCSSVIVIACL